MRTCIANPATKFKEPRISFPTPMLRFHTETFIFASKRCTVSCNFVIMSLTPKMGTIGRGGYTIGGHLGHDRIVLFAVSNRLWLMLLMHKQLNNNGWIQYKKIHQHQAIRHDSQNVTKIRRSRWRNQLFGPCT